MVVRAIGLARYLIVCHGCLVHLWRDRVGVLNCRAARSLVWRVRIGTKRSSLIGAMELRCHVAATARGILRRPERGSRRKGHLVLVSRLRVGAAAATLVWIAATARASWRARNVAGHVAMGGLGRFTTEVGSLGSRAHRWLVWAHLALRITISCHRPAAGGRGIHRVRSNLHYHPSHQSCQSLARCLESGR